jgi:hypothetical protein
VWPVLTEIYQCHACSCQEIKDGNAPGQLAGDDIDAGSEAGYDAECAHLIQVMKWCEEHLPEGEYHLRATSIPAGNLT